MNRDDQTAATRDKLNRPMLQRWDLKRGLKWAACLGVPLLLVVFLVGGGGALLGSGASLLPYLAILACPLVMFFMMLAMHGHQKQDPGKREGETGQSSSGASASTGTDDR